jgi:virulence-associated protein VagC
MFFTRTHRCQLAIQQEDLKNRLIGKHVKIHELDFEVFEDEDQSLIIEPHTEQIEEIKTLPTTRVKLTAVGDKTNVVIISKMRTLDSGGPQLIVIFCIFLFISSIVLMVSSKETTLSYIFASLGLVIFTLFCIRLQTGYFDYVRKIRSYVTNKGVMPSTASANIQAIA